MYRTSTKFDPKTNIWSGIEAADIFNNQLTIGHILLYIMNKNPYKIVQISDDTGICLTNNDIRIRSIQAAQFYQKIGIKEGDIIGFMNKNSDNLTSLVLGAFLCGIIVNGLCPTFEKDVVISCFKQAKPKLIFCDDDNYETIRQFLNDTDLKCPVYTVNKQIKNIPHITEFIHQINDDSVDNFIYPILSHAKNIPAVIMYSSGTTGNPKGICVSHASLLVSTNYLNATSDDTCLVFSTINAFTWYWMTLSGLMRGATKILTTKDYTPELMVELINKYKVTVPFTLPSHMAILLHNINNRKIDISSVRLYIIGGGILNQHLVTELNSVLPKSSVVKIYGMSEAGIVALTNKLYKSGSVGKLAANVKIKIINNDGVAVGAGHYGEVLIHPQFPFLGYYGKPQETKEAYDEEGWVHTGDIGYFDENENLVIVDRKKDMFKFDKFHYFPSEIEDVIMEMPQVNQVCVASMLDKNGNDLPTALVVKKPTANLSVKEILDYTAMRLEEYKQLKGGVYLVNALPLSYAGKYKRDGAKAMAINLYNQQKQSCGNI